MNIIDLTDFTFSSDRALFRREIIDLFLKESPGTGRGEFTSKYKYLVKKIGQYEVYLQRPAQFNNGFDFTLNVSNINFNPGGRSTTRPTHNNILVDLEIKKKADPQLYSELIISINEIYSCKIPSKSQFNFIVGLDTEVLLECIKWLFAEQDVTYWNYSGRAMFYSSICEV
jgi:hypothetical protein